MDKFNLYAKYYDLLYSDKDYSGEVDYLDYLIKKSSPNSNKSILDLGCGTGIHANLLSQKGYYVDGVDLSEKMIERAKKSFSNNQSLKFFVGDITQFEIPKQYDIVTSLFHVISYQNTNEDLIKSFKTAYNHLKKGGIFIFDFWYGPGVLSDLPEERIKELENDEISVIRKAIPVIHINDNIVDVNYEVSILNKASETSQIIYEKHSMRYLFKKEIELCFQQVGFELLNILEWMSNKTPSDKTWNAVIIAKKQ